MHPSIAPFLCCVLACGAAGAAPALPGPAFPVYADVAALNAACESGLAGAADRVRQLETHPADSTWLPAWDALNCVHRRHLVADRFPRQRAPGQGHARRRRGLLAALVAIRLDAGAEPEALRCGEVAQACRRHRSKLRQLHPRRLRGRGRRPCGGATGAGQGPVGSHRRSRPAIRPAHSRPGRQARVHRRRAGRCAAGGLEGQGARRRRGAFCSASTIRATCRCSSSPSGRPRASGCGAPSRTRAAPRTCSCWAKSRSCGATTRAFSRSTASPPSSCAAGWSRTPRRPGLSSIR